MTHEAGLLPGFFLPKRNHVLAGELGYLRWVETRYKGTEPSALSSCPGHSFSSFFFLSR